MTVLGFEHRLLYDSEYEIRIPLTIVAKAGARFDVRAVVDTAASISIFDSGLLPRIGIDDIGSGDAAAINVVDGRRIGGYIHTVGLEVAGIPIHVPIFFSSDLPNGVDNLLGLIGVLDQIDIAIVHRERTLYVRSSG